MLWNRIPVGITTRDVAFNQDVKALAPTSEIQAGYLLQWFMASENMLLHKVVGTGIGAGKLDTDETKRLPFLLPSWNEQAKIADFLTAVDTRIEQLVRKRALLEDYKKGAMQQIFTQAIRFKDDKGNEFPDWEETTIGEYLISYRLGGNYSNSESVTQNPLIKMGNLRRGLITLNKIEYISEADELNSDDLLKEGDLLFNTRNTLDLVGKVAIWREELSRAYYNSNIMRLDFPNTWFMNYRFNSYQGIKSLRRIATGTTSVAAIYTRDLLKVAILAPSSGEQTKIANFLSAIDSKIEQASTQIAHTQNFKKGLLQQMFV